MSWTIPEEWRLPGCALLALMFLVLVAAIWGRINEASNLRTLAIEDGMDISVALAFEPERFHIEAFQKVGRYQGWANGRASIMAIDADALHQLARNYWILDINVMGAEND